MKKLALLIAAALLVVPPATAAAKRIQHVGAIVGSKDSEVRLRVTKRRGKVRKVSKFEADGALLRCERGGNFSLQFAITGAIRVNKRNRFKARVPSQDDPDEKVRVAGRVKKHGRKVVGNLRSSKLTRNGESCVVPKQRFRTGKRRARPGRR
jgi:hypothetical protein